MRRSFVGVVIALCLIAYALSGWVVLAPGEVAVVRRLGRVQPRAWTAGAHWGWPIGFDRITRVRTEEVRRLLLGLAGTPGPGDTPGEGEFLTGDLNLLRAQATVQFRVADPVAFVIRSGNLDSLLGRLAESSLTRALAQRGIDDALRSGRAAVARDAEADLIRAVERHRLGIAILSMSLTDARPPAEVAREFAEAQAAASEHDRRINEAKTYAATSLPAANAQALARTERARAEADRAVALARSRAGRFLALLTQADRSRALTIRRLYLDAVRELLPRVKRKLVMTADEPVDLSILGIDK